MAETQFTDNTKSWPFLDLKTEPYDTCHNDDDDAASTDSVLCVFGSRLVQTGFTCSNSAEEDCVVFVNAGSGETTIKQAGDVKIKVDGGDCLRTDENVIDGGDVPQIYQSGRYGNFSYSFNNLSPGDYFVDLHFAEIVNVSGPGGIRVFDVFIQEEKVISGLDIYSLVGANKALQVVDIRVSVGQDEAVMLRFEGTRGSPMVSGICIRKANEFTASKVEHWCVKCKSCAAEVEITPTQDKYLRLKSMAKYERKIEELKTRYQLKEDECYEAWMSLTSSNQQLEKVRMELDNKYFQNLRLDQEMEKQAVTLRALSDQLESNKRKSLAAIFELEQKIKIMKEEQSHLSYEAHKCADSIPELNKMVYAVQALVEQCESLKLKFSEEQAKRKKLHNELQEVKGNIRVFCRCRPLSKAEASAGLATIVDFNPAKDGELGILTGGSAKKTYKFDRVYTPKDNQIDVFTDAAPLVTSVLDGYNVCIFAYGQTGTGKTFTMEGTDLDRGVNYRTLEQLFKIAEDRKETFAYGISVSVIEVYNEQIRDLLATSSTAKKLEIRQASEGVHHVPGVVEAKVENIKQVWDVLQAGSNSRAVGSNNVNEHSSRSHCMLCIFVRAHNLTNGERTNSKLWLVDLAGSERLAKTEAQGERLREAQNINKSLSALGDVISALANKSSHIPYRNSKLTHLLQDSLGGDSKTLMFVQISPLEQDLGETSSSLNFATRVRGVELGPTKRQIDVGELQKLKVMLDKAKQEMRNKDDALQKLEETLLNTEAKARSKDHLCKSLQEKVDELEGQLGSKTELCRQLERQVTKFSEVSKGKEDNCLYFQRKVTELEKKLREQEHADSMALQCKVKGLEKCWKERTRDYEQHAGMLQQKVMELENKLMVKRDQPGSQLLQQKIKEAEENRQEYASPIYYTEKIGATPKTSRVESICDMDPPSRWSLSSVNQSINAGSDLLKKTDSLRELRRKRQVQGKGNENNFLFPASSHEKKILSVESDKSKPIDSSRALTRITGRKLGSSTAQRSFSGNRIGRDQTPVLRESNHQPKIWLR